MGPIGIYDSGVGGLTVWMALKRLLPLDLIYYGDTAHVPYGDKTREQILFYSHNIIQFFREQGCSTVVAACNTSSALALPVLQVSAGLPLFGVIEPAITSALKSTKNKRVGLLATTGTVASGSYQRMFKQRAPDIRLYTQGSPKLVPLIEAGTVDGSVVIRALHEYLDPLLQEQVDTIILGCTHYPFLLPVIRRIVGPQVTLVDPAQQMSLDIVQWFSERGITGQNKQPVYQFWVSGQPAEFSKRAAQFVQEELPTVHRHQQVEEQPSRVAAFIGTLGLAWRGDQDD